MIREDPREEVMKLRIRYLMDQAANRAGARKECSGQKRRVANFLRGIQVASGGMALLMLFVAWWPYRHTPSELFIGFVCGSRQFVSCIAYLLAFAFSSVVYMRRHDDPKVVQLQQMVTSLERLFDQINDFRVETEPMRKVDTATHTVWKGKIEKKMIVGQRKPKSRDLKDNTRKRSRKKKGEQDILAMWAPNDFHGTIDYNLVAKAMEDSYKKLPPLPEDFKRPGGDRMGAFIDRLGGVDEEELCVRFNGQTVAALTDNQGDPDLPELPSLMTDSVPPPGSAPTLFVNGRTQSRLSASSEVDRTLPPAPNLPPAPQVHVSPAIPSGPQLEIPGHMPSPGRIYIPD